MSTREERIAIFEGIRELCQSHKKLIESIEESINGQKIYWEDDIVECPEPEHNKPFETVLSAQKTLEASKNMPRQVRECVFSTLLLPYLPAAVFLQENRLRRNVSAVCQLSGLH